MATLGFKLNTDTDNSSNKQSQISRPNRLKAAAWMFVHELER